MRSHQPWEGESVLLLVSRLSSVVHLVLSELVLEEEEVVGGGDGDDVLVRVPRRVEDLLVEVQAVHVDLVLLPLSAGAHLQYQRGSDL